MALLYQTHVTCELQSHKFFTIFNDTPKRSLVALMHCDMALENHCHISQVCNMQAKNSLCNIQCEILSQHRDFEAQKGCYIYQFNFGKYSPKIRPFYLKFEVKACIKSINPPSQKRSSLSSEKCYHSASASNIIWAYQQLGLQTATGPQNFQQLWNQPAFKKDCTPLV